MAATILRKGAGEPLGLYIAAKEPPRGFWAGLVEAARRFHHVRYPGVWKTLGMLF